jgi:predicted enzyme related to lactoylglutathione lyase
MTAVGQFGGVVLECPDPAALANFYSQLIGWPISYQDDDWWTLGTAKTTGVTLSFQKAPGYRSPVWPDPESSMQVHFDLRVDDLDEAEQRAQQLGATKFDHQPDPEHFRVMADPVGHPFCVCTS